MENNRNMAPATMLQNRLEELEEAGSRLREALMRRNSDAIWDATARQEHILEQLAALRNIPDIMQNMPAENSRRIRELATRTKTIQRINRALTRVFMKIIDSTLNAIGNPAQNEPLTYSPAGYLSRNAPAALFVQQTG